MTAGRPRASRPRARTLVVGGYGYRNLGDEAILAGLLTTLDRGRTTVVSRDPRATSRLHAVRSVSLLRAAAEVPLHDTILIGGGGLFGRDMGTIGRLLPAAADAATRMGRTVRLRGIGLDRDMLPGTRRALGRLLPRTSEVAVRDRESLDIARELGADAQLAPDLSALATPAEPSEAARALATAGADIRRPMIVVALTAVDPVLGSRMLRAMALAAAARPALSFVALPMSRHPTVASHDDGVLAEKLQRLVPDLSILDVGDPAVALAVVGQAAALIGMRYHSLLFADRMRIPLIAIPYAEKCRHWLAEHDVPTVEPDAGAVGAALDRVLGARQRMAS